MIDPQWMTDGEPWLSCGASIVDKMAWIVHASDGVLRGEATEHLRTPLQALISFFTDVSRRPLLLMV